jgi:hypothetical protein
MLVKHMAAAATSLLRFKTAFLLNEINPIFTRMANATCRKVIDEKPASSQMIMLLKGEGFYQKKMLPRASHLLNVG